MLINQITATGRSAAAPISTPSTGDWQLSPTNYIAAKMPMTLVFPRNDDAANWSYCRNAYPGTKWNIPIIIQGGAWPFKYEITDADGILDISIGGELDRAIDVDTGRTVHTVADDYGVLTIDSPITGSYNLVITVTDQGGIELPVPITLTVGTAGWLFLDPDAADETGDGTFGDPFKTMENITGNLSTTNLHSGKRVYLMGGTTAVEGMIDLLNPGNTELSNNTNPLQWIGYPDESVILEFTEGWFVLDGPDDCYFADMTVQFASGFAPTNKAHMFRQTAGFDRFTLFNCDFNDFKTTGSPDGGSNTGVMYFDLGNKNYVGISHCTGTGEFGTFAEWYDIKTGCVEHFTVSNANIVTLDSGSSGVIYLKDDPDTVTLRNINIWDNNTWGPSNNYGAVAWGGQAGHESVELCYSTLDCPVGPRGGAIYSFVAAGLSVAIDNTFVYRNSLIDDFRFEGDNYTGMVNFSNVHENNVLDTGSMPTSAASKITSTDNIDGATYFDSGMKLLETSGIKDAFLGTHGAEIAE